MKKNYLLLFIFISGLILFSLWSCSEEPLEGGMIENHKDPLSYIRNEYIKGRNELLGKTIEWEKAREYKNTQKETILITVPIKNGRKNLIEELTFRIDNHKVSGHLWKFTSDTSFSPDDYELTAHQIMEKMSGRVSYISLEGSFRYEKIIVEGRFVDEMGKGGSGPMDSPGCRGCHGNIDEVIIPAPGGGGPSVPPSNPSVPIPDIIIIPPPPSPQEEKCKQAAAGSQKATDLSKNSKFSAAKQGILNAFGQNGGENGVGFGSNTANGPIDATGIQSLGATSGNINNPFAYPIADMHNHPQNTAPSAGDVYSMMFYHNQYNTFNTRYVVLSNGTVYALTITNADAFANFLSNYPPSQQPGYAPNFPTALNYEYTDIYTYYNGTQEMALAFILDKYNAGIALTKMDASGNFKKLGTRENTNGDNKVYSEDNCK
ncbi:hypothetical protein [Chryseobacterium sp. POE27]|uniref:hypothetical protein n=1 Tax=Chryseobacterium sp. POE27 TaxID=3138177 RepID=UPI0032193D48